MPDQPLPQRHPKAATPIVATHRHYAELHCRTNYSFLEGASHPDELVNRAAELGLHALAITDRNSLAGVVRAHVAAKEVGLRLLIAAEITPVDSLPVVLLATNRSAYANLSQLITHGRRRSPKGECWLTFEDITRHANGLLACVPLPVSSDTTTIQQLHNYRTCFRDNCYGLAELHCGPNDRLKLDRLIQLANNIGLPLAASNDVHYHVPKRQPLHDILTAIRHGCTVADLGHRRFSNAERCLKPANDMQHLFAAAPAAVARTLEIADRCTFSLDELRYEYPEELCPNDATPTDYLSRLTWHGAAKRYPDGIPAKVNELIRHEIALISELKYEAYFLTVYDLVRFARERGILCQGRGSAANSAVCFCLGITEVDPNRIEVLFERFMSKERDEPPDIDVDFEHERREEVIQYIYGKYGRDRSGMTGVVITYRPRSAVRDVGKALGFSVDYVDRLAKSVDHMVSEESLAKDFHSAGAAVSSHEGRIFQSLVKELLDFPRHLSQHPGGMVMTGGMLSDFVPIENSAMPNRTVIQWDKNDLDALGLLKVDILALGMLTAIRRCFDLIQQHYGQQFTLANVPAEDHAVYEMICQADTIGVFQIESRAQMNMLPRLQPRCFYDLVIEVAIVRPGPIQGDMVHPFLRRRCGEEPVEYADDRIRSVLFRTLGVPIFQEQAMKLAVVAAGFTPGEADQLRKAMGAWRRQGVIEQFHRNLVQGMADNGYDSDFAERVFKQIQGFGEYGFPESHAASFALLVYVSAWLKHRYPAAFTAALLNSQPMGFYSPSQLVGDVRKHGVTVLPVDVCNSNWDCTLEPMPNGQFALRLGFRMIKGMSNTSVAQLSASRTTQMFQSFEDFRHRTRLSSSVLTKLSEADAFRSLKMNRRQALWNSLPNQKEQPLYDGQETDTAVHLPAMPPHEQVLADYKTVGLSLKGHPLKTYRSVLQTQGITPAEHLTPQRHGSRIRVAGLVLIRQHPDSANGVTFVTLEDETGTVNLIIRPDVWNRYRTIARTASVLIARGKLQHQYNVIHVLVDQLAEFTTTNHNISVKSRDFR